MTRAQQQRRPPRPTAAARAAQEASIIPAPTKLMRPLWGYYVQSKMAAVGSRYAADFPACRSERTLMLHFLVRLSVGDRLLFDASRGRSTFMVGNAGDEGGHDGLGNQYRFVLSMRMVKS